MRGMFNVECQPEDSLFEALVRSSLPKGRMVERRTETAVQTEDK